MTSSSSPSPPPIGRRRFLQAGLCGAAGVVLYPGEIERHWIDVTNREFFLRGLSPGMNGMRVVQLSDIHLDDFTEPYFLRQVVDRVNRLQPDAVFLTGDYVSDILGNQKFSIGAAWQCAHILSAIQCKRIYAILGNHDIAVDANQVTAALEANGIPVLRNACLPLDFSGSRIWLAGLDDILEGHPDPDLAIPASIRNRPNEPVILLCHAPDYADIRCPHAERPHPRRSGPAAVLWRCRTSRLGQKVCRGCFPVRRHATLCQSRHWHHRGTVSLELPSGNHRPHIAFRLNSGRPPEYARSRELPDRLSRNFPR